MTTDADSGEGATTEATARPVDASSAMGVQIGDDNTQHNSYHIGTLIQTAYFSAGSAVQPPTAGTAEANALD